jgi:hypothetical protein
MQRAKLLGTRGTHVIVGDLRQCLPALEALPREDTSAGKADIETGRKATAETFACGHRTAPALNRVLS